MSAAGDSGRPLRVFLTGASSGLGLALARHYARSGAQLGLVARREEVLREFCADLPGEHLVLVADVASAAQMQSAAQAFIERFGTPDVVIANAGVSVGTLTEEVEDLAAFDAVLRTNLFGLVTTFHPFVAAMRERGSGRLVGIASVAGIRGLPGAGAYSASKAAAMAYLESLRVELHGTGVKVVTIAPGYVATPMTAINPYPMPFILPAEVAAARIARLVARGLSYAVVPWQMGVVAKLLRLLPNAVFDRLFAKAGRKPRGLLPPINRGEPAVKQVLGDRSRETGDVAMAGEEMVIERRRRQRFVARRGGEFCFWAVLDGVRFPLQDLSIEGYGVQIFPQFEVGKVFPFVLQRAGVPDEVRGLARAVNKVEGVDSVLGGFLFESFEGDGRERLEEWLTAHVLASATIPISEKDASAIVSGPSLI